MRILAIGNIHGCIRSLDALLEEVDTQQDDVLVTLGDYIDRGPDSKGVLDRLLENGGKSAWGIYGFVAGRSRIL